MIVPPKTYRSNEAPHPRESIFVIDTSRSMHSETMRQARDALLFALERLTDKARFNIISFSSEPRRLFTESWIADMPSLYCGHRQRNATDNNNELTTDPPCTHVVGGQCGETHVLR